MAKLHELLAAEKTPTAAWHQLIEDTTKKFKNPANFFDGFSKSLKMIEDNPANANVEAQAREEKPVVTTVFDTLDYAFGIYATMEDLQYQKNATNCQATGTVLWKGQPFLVDMPTLDATKYWVKNTQLGLNVWETQYAEETTKTEKQVVPVEMSPATKEHPAQVQAVGRDVVVGKFTTVKRSGAATAVQKSDAIKRVDELMVEIKQARMRANETVTVNGKIAQKVVELLMEPLK